MNRTGGTTGARTQGFMRERGGQTRVRDCEHEAYRLFTTGLSVRAVASELRVSYRTAEAWIKKVDDHERTMRFRGAS